MSVDRSEIHKKVLTFLMEEWGRTGDRQLVGVDLFFSPGNGFKDDEIRKWERADEADLFAELGNVEKLVEKIIEIAEGEADAKPPGRYRFVVRARQFMGSRPYTSFSLQPSFTGGDDDANSMSLVAPGGGGPKSNDIAVAQILANNNGQLMRTNTQMFDSAFRPLSQMNAQLLAELISARAENSALQRKLAEAETNKLEREFQIMAAADKNNRANAMVQKFMQLGTVVAAKFATGTPGAAQLGEASPLSMLIGELWMSFREDQKGALMQILDMPQKVLFHEILNMVKPPEPPGPPPGSPAGVNGTPT